jgi:orotate phosphoribosyltransferase
LREKVGLDNFDAIVYSGMSGAGVATAVAVAVGKSLLMVRKVGVDCHSGLIVEGATRAERVVIIDDCIASGATLVRVVRAIEDSRANFNEYEWSLVKVPKLKVVAVVLYNDSNEYQGFIDRCKEQKDVWYRGVFTASGMSEITDAMSGGVFYGFKIVNSAINYTSNLKEFERNHR